MNCQGREHTETSTWQALQRNSLVGRWCHSAQGPFFALNYWVFWSFSWYWCEWSVSVMKYMGAGVSACCLFTCTILYIRSILYTEVHLMNCLIKSLLHCVSILYDFSKLSLHIWKTWAITLHKKLCLSWLSHPSLHQDSHSFSSPRNISSHVLEPHLSV